MGAPLKRCSFTVFATAPPLFVPPSKKFFPGTGIKTVSLGLEDTFKFPYRASYFLMSFLGEKKKRNERAGEKLTY